MLRRQLCALLLASSPARPTAFTFGDPLNLHSWASPAAASPASIHLPLLLGASSASAITASELDRLTPEALSPAAFQPVCPASDGVYRFGQGSVVALVGPDSYKEYAPLIAGGLLRVRLELCVVESFFYEAIVPFIQEKGLSWVLPLHETVETFLAGTVFAVATNFILIGSTKIVTVLATYGDLFFGAPLRLVGGAGWRGLEDKRIGMVAAADPEPPRPWWRGPKKREPPPIEEIIAAQWSPETSGKEKAELILWGGMLGVGQASRILRETFEAVDLFVGRYLLTSTVAYVGIKFVHFKLFDPFPL
jgi:hypothetical protein